MSYRQVGKFELNKINPFLDATVQHIEKGDKLIFMATKDADRIIDSEGNVKGHSLFAKRIKVDKAEFAKIYVSSIASWFGLSKAGIRIFGYITSVIKPNKDDFMMNFDDCMAFTTYTSKKTIITGISELLENQFIARGTNSYHYYINPTIFFNGDRISFLEQYEVKPKSDDNLMKRNLLTKFE